MNSWLTSVDGIEWAGGELLEEEVGDISRKQIKTLRVTAGHILLTS